jgi:hypothetical protein
MLPPQSSKMNENNILFKDFLRTVDDMLLEVYVLLRQDTRIQDMNMYKSTSLYVQKLKGCNLNDTESMYGDLILGFYTTADVRYELYFGMNYDSIESAEIKKGEFRMAIGNDTPLLLITKYSRPFIDVSQGDIQSIYAVYGKIPHEYKRVLKENNVMFQNKHMYYMYIRGHILSHLGTLNNDEMEKVCSHENDGKQVLRLCGITPITKIAYAHMQQKKEQLEIIRKELVEKTWHPNRLVHWCLSIEEIRDIFNHEE